MTSQPEVTRPKFDGEYITLKPNRDLINTQFEKYSLSNEAFPVAKKKLEQKVRHLLPTEKQWAFQFVKLYCQFESLVIDRHYSSDDFNRFYWVGENGFIYTSAFDVRARKWASVKMAHRVAIPTEKFGVDVDRLPESIVFPDDCYAFVGNGCGAVTLFRTYNRGFEGRWTPVLTFVLDAQNENLGETYDKYNFCEEFYCTPCVVADARRTHFNQFDVLLQSIFERDEAEVKQDKEKTKFATRFVWLTISIDNHRTCKLERVREFHCDGRLDFATLDKDSTSIVTVGGRKPKLIKDSAKKHPEDEKPESSQGNGESIPPIQPAETMDQDTDITDPTYAYIWTQTGEDVSALFKVGEEITKNDVEFTLKSDQLTIKIKGVTLLSGSLGGPVDVGSSTWTFGNHRLEITLFKGTTTTWTELVQDDKRGKYQEDSKLVADVMEQLEKFTSDKEVAGFDGSGPGFNQEELEECDQSEYEITYVTWMDGESHKVLRYSDISSHQLLFTLRLSAGGPTSFCLRHDVDAVIWSLEEKSPIEHTLTLNAFGYVQAGKQSRRFTTCSPDGEYAVITDKRNHAYVYWQNVPLEPEVQITNRKTGKKTSSVAKQAVLSMARQDEDYKEDDPNQEFIGIYAHERVLFLLTHNGIYANVLKPIQPTLSAAEPSSGMAEETAEEAMEA